MKRTFIALTFGLIAYSSFGQWSNTSNNETQGAVKIKNYLLFDADGDFTGGNYFTIQDDPTNNYLRMGYGFDKHLIINSKGNVGIGITNPNTPLEILSKASNKGLKISANGKSTKISMFVADGDYGYLSLGGSTVLRGNGRVSYFDGNVGIGTTQPDMKLTVNGKIHAKEIKIDLAIQAPDYVFKSDYNLRSIEEVENFIKEHNHLPEMPSAKEFAKNGVMQVEMDMNLLKKIEELTLYTIEQEKKIKKLEKQRREIEELKKQNSRIKNLEKLVQKLLKDKN